MSEGRILERADTALLIVDMQNDIVGGRAPGEGVPAVGDLISCIQTLKAEFHRAGLPVIYTRVAYRHSYVDSHRNAPARFRSTLRESESGSAVIDDLAPGPDDYIVVKRRIGAFYQTDLELLLRGLAARMLVVTGTSLPRAVESTVREAHSRDIDCVAVSDACYAASQEEHAHCLEVLSKYGFADVLTADRVLGASLAGAQDG